MDTAQYYSNETGVGNGVRRAIDEGIVTREEMFITTKVMPGNYDRAYQSIDESLERLGFDYIDLMLVHQSGLNDTELQGYVRQYGTVIESYYPLGGRGHTEDLFSDSTIDAIAKAHGKTAAQIILRWHIQAGYITIPGSSNPEHIAENIGIFDFELSESEMQSMTSLNTGQRYENW